LFCRSQFRLLLAKSITKEFDLNLSSYLGALQTSYIKRSNASRTCHLWVPHAPHQCQLSCRHCFCRLLRPHMDHVTWKL